MNRSVTFALGAGGLSVPIKGSSGASIDLGISDVQGLVRWHPFHGAFFLGAALGYQAIKGSASDTFSFTVPQTNGIPPSLAGNYSIKATAQASVDSPYLTPQFGWFWVFHSGFCIGLDFGVQVPLASKTELSFTTDNPYTNVVLSYLEQLQQYQNLQNQVQDAGNKVGKLVLPYTTLLRLGWMF